MDVEGCRKSQKRGRPTSFGLERTPRCATLSAMTSVPVQSAKQALRRTIGRKLKAVPPTEVMQDCEGFPVPPLFRSWAGSRADTDDSPTAAAVVSRVLASAWYQRAQNVSCYLSTPTGEVNTDAIILDALAKGEPACTSSVCTEAFADLDMTHRQVHVHPLLPYRSAYSHAHASPSVGRSL